MPISNENYVFKLNVQPQVLKRFGIKGFETLKSEVIPNAIFNSYNDLLVQVDIQLDGLSFIITNDFSYISQSYEFNTLLEVTSEIASMYKEITIDYQKEKGIFYTPVFLDKLDEAIELRKQLISLYPILYQSSSHYLNTMIEKEIEKQYDFKIDNDVGKGIDHLRRVKKIELYINELLEKDEEDVSVYYDYDKEQLIIYNISIEDALEHSKRIEEKINSQKTEIGKIKINPIYETVVLTKNDFSSIELVTTYPNGTNDELDILEESASRTGAREVRTKLLAADGQPLEHFTDKAIELARPAAQKGYLSDVKSNSKGVINYIKSKIRKV